MLSESNHLCCDKTPGCEAGFIRGDLTSAGQPTGAGQLVNKNHILFVDDEAILLRVLKVGLRSMAVEWEMSFAESGEQALDLIKQQAFDVIVTDMRMPGINGVQLLNHAQRLHPQTIRIVMSGYSDLRDVVHCVALAHQFLAKPCSLEQLKDCLNKVTHVKHQLGNEKLRELTGGMDSLPSLPELYLKIVEAVQSPSSSTQRISEIASQDPALSAKLLQLTNSAFFGFSRRIFSVNEAVQLLGVGIIQSLALAVPLFSAFDRKKCPRFSIEQIWEHSTATAILGRKIATSHHADAYLSDQAFAAGVLHDIGKLILADKLPGQYNEIIQEAQAAGSPIAAVEFKHLQATHAEVGGYLLALWGLPVPLVEAVACHHQPKRCNNKDLCLAGIVHIANSLHHELSARPSQILTPVDADYLQHLGLCEQYENWRQDLRDTNAGVN